MKEKHWTTLVAIREFTEEHGYAPTIRDLAGVLGVSPPTASSRVKDLAVHGYVRIGQHTVGGAYALTEQGQAVSVDG